MRAGKAGFIPELSAFVRQTHQEGVPFLRNTFTTVGLSFSWPLLDGGRKAYVVSQRNALVNQAHEEVQQLRRRLQIDLGKG